MGTPPRIESSKWLYSSQHTVSSVTTGRITWHHHKPHQHQLQEQQQQRAGINPAITFS
jgi:hypothetical protein